MVEHLRSADFGFAAGALQLHDIAVVLPVSFQFLHRCEAMASLLAVPKLARDFLPAFLPVLLAQQVSEGGRTLVTLEIGAFERLHGEAIDLGA